MCCSPSAHQRAGQELSEAPSMTKQAHSGWFVVAGLHVTEDSEQRGVKGFVQVCMARLQQDPRLFQLWHLSALCPSSPGRC